LTEAWGLDGHDQVIDLVRIGTTYASVNGVMVPVELWVFETD
jgi:hypothetical protein